MSLISRSLAAQLGQGNMVRFTHLKANRSLTKPDEADDDDAEDDLIGGQQRLAVGDHVADAGRLAPISSATIT